MTFLGKFRPTRKVLRFLFHPIFLFVLAQVSWGLLMFVWIRWYVLRSREVETLVQVLPLGHRGQDISTLILIQGCVLMGFILISLYFIFLAFRKQVMLNKMQHGILDSVTHELKTPLAAIRLHTETLLLRPLSEESRHRFLMKSMVEIARLQRLIDGVLLSARMEGGNLGGEREAHDLLDVIEVCWARLVERSAERRVLVFERPEATFESTLNRQQMETLFDNLFDNAFKYTDSGGRIELSVRLTRDQLMLDLRDSGHGLEKSDLRRIFRKFVRVELGRTRRVSGSGLGLYVCESIVKTHRGRIWASSEGLGKGAVFHVELPRLDSPRGR